MSSCFAPRHLDRRLPPPFQITAGSILAEHNIAICRSARSAGKGVGEGGTTPRTRSHIPGCHEKSLEHEPDQNSSAHWEQGEGRAGPCMPRVALRPV